MLSQLQLDFGEDFSTKTDIRLANHPKSKVVHPTDITAFIENFLPEYKEGFMDGTLTEGQFFLPRLEAVHNVKPEQLVPFSAVMSTRQVSDFHTFHFFLHDYQFERFWKNPSQYLPYLQKFTYGIGTDFSMYLWMHPAEQLINCCRNRLLTFLLQKQGFTIIPDACFGNLESLNWAFDGLPMHSVIALTTQGCIHNGVAKQTLLNGLHKLVRLKKPEQILVYGKFPEQWLDKFPVEIVIMPTFTSKWRAC